MSFRSSFEHRDDLLRAAIDEFCDRGFDAASLNRILATAGVSKGQMYHHFANKEALYLGVVEWLIDQKIGWMVDHPPEVDDADDVFSVLRAQILGAVEFATAHPDVDRMVRALLAERGRPIFETVTRRFGFTAEGPMGHLVAEHHRRGAFRTDVSAELVARFIDLVVNRAPDLLDLEKASDMGRQVDDLITALRDGIGARSS